ncbi:MAG: hypothetical protein OXG04_24590 [Acidobacteria bacterium]|nr:hypothetical protein [Acidobacteriota bacterium]
MRRIRAADRDKMLCCGVYLPIDAGICGRCVWPGYKRCHACDARYAALPEDSGRAVPLLDDLSARDDPCLRW